MLNYHEQVISFDLAKELELMGFVEASMYVYCENKESKEVTLFPGRPQIDIRINATETKTIDDPKYKFYQAYNSTELMHFLPAMIYVKPLEKKDETFSYFYLHMYKRPVKHIQYIINYYCDSHKGEDFLKGEPVYSTSLFHSSCYDENLSNALAKIIIRFIKLNLLKYNKDIGKWTAEQHLKHPIQHENNWSL